MAILIQAGKKVPFWVSTRGFLVFSQMAKILKLVLAYA